HRIVNKPRFAGAWIANDAEGSASGDLFGLLYEGIEQGSFSRAAAIGGEPQGCTVGPAGAMFNIDELPSCNRPVEALESEPAARLYFGRTRDSLVDGFRDEDGVGFRRLLETAGQMNGGSDQRVACVSR